MEIVLNRNVQEWETDGWRKLLPVTWKVHLPAPASLMTLQVYSPQPSRFRLRMVYSVSSLWSAKAPAWSSRFDSSHSKRNTREGWARSTLQVITTGLPRPWRISMYTGSTVGGSEWETKRLRQAQMTFESEAKETVKDVSRDKIERIIRQHKKREVEGETKKKGVKVQVVRVGEGPSRLSMT